MKLENKASPFASLFSIAVSFNFLAMLKEIQEP